MKYVSQGFHFSHSNMGVSGQLPVYSQKMQLSLLENWADSKNICAGLGCFTAICFCLELNNSHP